MMSRKGAHLAQSGSVAFRVGRPNCGLAPLPLIGTDERDSACDGGFAGQLTDLRKFSVGRDPLEAGRPRDASNFGTSGIVSVMAD